ncbi:MAG: hypothetical protein SCJ97_02985 [Bacillota bacterium]|nr:hypothetical protein [Bacillota bacterium]
MNNKLIELGFSERAIQEASSYDQLFPGRVITHYQGLYKVATTSGEIFAEVSGRIKFNAAGSADYPVTGDFVMVDHDNSSTGNAIIHHILNRKSIFERKAAGTAQDTQVVAVNIDFIFICMALNSDFNLRRLEC